MDYPERRTQQGHALDQGRGAPVELDGLRAQAVHLGVGALVHRRAALAPGEQAHAGAFHHPRLRIGGIKRPGTAFREPAAAPPVVVAGAAVNRAFARKGDVGLAIGIDQRVRVVAVDALPAGRHGREILLDVRAELQHGAVLQVQVDVALERDRTRPEGGGRDDDRAAARLVHRQDGVVDGVRGQLRGVAGDGAAVYDGEAAVGEMDLAHRGQDAVSLRPRVVSGFFLTASRCENRRSGQQKVSE